MSDPRLRLPVGDLGGDDWAAVWGQMVHGLDSDEPFWPDRRPGARRGWRSIMTTLGLGVLAGLTYEYWLRLAVTPGVQPTLERARFLAGCVASKPVQLNSPFGGAVKARGDYDSLDGLVAAKAARSEDDLRDSKIWPSIATQKGSWGPHKHAAHLWARVAARLAAPTEGPEMPGDPFDPSGLLEFLSAADALRDKALTHGYRFPLIGPPAGVDLIETEVAPAPLAPEELKMLAQYKPRRRGA